MRYLFIDVLRLLNVNRTDLWLNMGRVVNFRIYFYRQVIVKQVFRVIDTAGIATC
jgi:hypothetical protein